MKKSNGTSNKRKNGRQIQYSFGPVNNLEEFLQPDWWRRIFNSMYLKTDADVVEDKCITSFELDMFTKMLDLEQDNVILDLACGQGRHTLELARRGFKNVFGIDRSHYLINRAKQTNISEGLSANFKEGDARKLPYSPDMFDVVMILGNSFGYFETIDDDLKILKEVLRVLKPNGKFLLDVADGNFLKDNFNPRSWEWINKTHFVCRERSLANDNERLISREVISNTKKGVIVDQFYAERLYTKEKLSGLLHEAGFRNIGFHNEYTTDSMRNQDLGMMERRIIATSEVIKEWTPVKQKSGEIKNVAVLLGDPKKTDIVKPDTVFDEDDYNTIQQLKIALSSLKDYKFIYLDNHDQLVNNLVKLRPQIDYVLNLCDEGFNN
ncbi:MAG: methyltransferase domain-containing protein, partial [Bacteroidales bacterium]